MTDERLAWKNASVIPGRDPECDRRDGAGMPMCRELFNCQQVGGWGINEEGEAEAFRPSAPPAIGDQLLSSVDVSWNLPSGIRKAA